MRKRKKETEFACFVKNLTPRAVKTTVPLGVVESVAATTDRQHRALVEMNRELYCAPAHEVHVPLPPPNQEVRLAPAPAPRPVRTEETRTEPPAPKDSDAPFASPESPIEEKPLAPPPAPAVVPHSESVPPSAAAIRRVLPVAPKRSAALGRGGKQHQYLQELLKQAAEKQGFRAIVEEPTADGNGRVDVALIRGDRRIACEISVASSKDQELGNVEKCLAAGYAEVLVVASKERQRQTLTKFVGDALDEADQEKVRYLLPEEAVEYLSAQTPEVSEKLVRGYRVKIRRTVVSAAEQESRRRQIAEVIMRSMARQGDSGTRPSD